MAVSLKEQYGVDEICGYIYKRDGYDFLKSQKDFFHLNETIILWEFDTMIGPNVFNCAVSEFY